MSDGGLEWYLLKDDGDVEQFQGRHPVIFRPKSLPALAAYGYDQEGIPIGIYVFPEDLRNMMGLLKNLAPAAFYELATQVREIAG